MMQSKGFVFLFLLVLSLQNHVESVAFISNPLPNRDKADDFAECVLKNISETPGFSEMEEEYIRLTVASLMPSVSTKSLYKSDTNDVQLKTVTMDFGVSEAEMLKSKKEKTPHAINSKIHALSKALEMCCRITLECDKEEFIANIQDFLREYATSIVIDEQLHKSKSSSETNDRNLFRQKKRRSVQTESITITDEDIQNCANAVLDNLGDANVSASCYKIFVRGVWDGKADRTLDGDTQKLITLMYSDNLENMEKVLDFIDKYVPRYVRELIVSYHTVIDNLKRNGDFNLSVIRPYFMRIKNIVSKIKYMNGNHYAEKYFYAKQIHKNMLEDMLTSLQVAEIKESFSVTGKDIQDCADTVKLDLIDGPKVLASCGKIFYRGVWDDKADRTLDGDTRKIISLIYDGKSENLARVLYFVDHYVPKNVRELIVSYDSVINESGRNGDLDLAKNQPYLLEIIDAVTEVKYMNGDDPAKNYQLAKQVHKDMLENILNNSKAENFSVTNDDIQNCANSAKLDLANESAVFASCGKIFNRDATEKSLDDDIRKLISLVYDATNENMPRLLYFIKKYGPRSVRERIVSYDAIINEFEKTEDFKLLKNQPYFGIIINALKDIKKMNGNHPAEKYKYVDQTYKHMMENKLRVFEKKESITITDKDIRNCANAVKYNLEDYQKVLVACAHIFNRGVWDAKADATLDRDIQKLIPLIYDGKRDNIAKVLDFIDKYIPKYVRELIVSYDALITEIEIYDDLSSPENRRYFRQIYKAVIPIKDMNGGHPAEKYVLALPRHKAMLENMLEELHAIKIDKPRQYFK